MCLFNRAQDLFSTTLSWIHFFSGMQRARLSKCTEKFRHLRMTGSYCPWVLLVACLCAWWNLVISIKWCVIRVCRGLGACSLSLVFPFLLNEMIYSCPACSENEKTGRKGHTNIIPVYERDAESYTHMKWYICMSAINHSDCKAVSCHCTMNGTMCEQCAIDIVWCIAWNSTDHVSWIYIKKRARTSSDSLTRYKLQTNTVLTK